MTTIASSLAQAPLILTLDIGTSSLRAMLYDGRGNHIQDALTKFPYTLRTTPDGGFEADADEMFERTVRAIDALLDWLGPKLAGEIAAVAVSSLAANILGEDAGGRAITPVYTYADTRSANAVAELSTLVDVPAVYARTGAPMHTGYWPGRFRWLAETRPQLYPRVVHWRTLDEYFYTKLFGRAYCSYSMASWGGMLDQITFDWDAEWLSVLPVKREQLPVLADIQDSISGLAPEFARRWPALARVPFFPAVGDGATSNIGCGATDRSRAALTVGTTGALRVVVEGPVKIPEGLWLYRVDKRRGLLGGSLSNGGSVYSWMTSSLNLPDAAAIETELAAMEPDSHGLTMLPFLAGERSPGYRSDARAAIAGMSLNTTPMHILRAGLEAVAYRFALIYELLGISPLARTIANGGALLSSRSWVQIMADVLGTPVIASGEPEASSRGAALLALEALRAIPSVEALPPQYGATLEPDAGRHARYERARARQRKLYDKLVLQQ